MRARWFIAAAGAAGVARMLLRPRPGPGQVAVVGTSALGNEFSMFREEFDSLAFVVDTVPPELLDIGLGGTGLEVGLREDIAGVIRAGRALEPAAIWNRICTEQGTDPETLSRRMAVFGLELMSLTRAGQLESEALDFPPPADPVGPMPIDTSDPANWFPRRGTARNPRSPNDRAS